MHTTRQPRNVTGQFLKGTHWRGHQVFREKSYLVAQYTAKKRSANDIAREHGVTPAAITFWLRQHGITIRNASESRQNIFGSPATSVEYQEYSRLLRLAFPKKYRAMSRNSYKRRRKPTELVTSERIERGRIRKIKKAAYTRNRRRTNINFNITCVLRGRLNAALKGANKSASTLKLLGCSIESFKLYLESKFESGMSWQNYGRGEGKWNIDHIMPCAIFDLTRPGHQRRCFHFSNMQPMWATENLRKNAKVLSNQFSLI